LNGIDKILDYGKRPPKAAECLAFANISFSAAMGLSLIGYRRIFTLLFLVVGLILIAAAVFREKTNAKHSIALTLVNLLISLLVIVFGIVIA
jgi:hypothetical protein